MHKLTILTVACAGMLFTTLPSAHADQWNERTTFTFSQAVEIPGHVLQPGTYVFKLMNSQVNRQIVEVTNKRENRVYGIFLAIPDYRVRPTGKTILTFEERTAGAPDAVKVWFYPGDNYGHAFVYPKVRAAELAKANNTNVPSVASESTNTNESADLSQSQMQSMQQEPMTAQTPSGTESEMSEAFPAPTATQPAATQPAANQPPANPEPSANREENLPKTGSDLPLFGLLGLLSLMGAGLLLGAGRILKAGR